MTVKHWVTPDQELLLRACLLEGGASRGAWAGWIETVDLENIDYGSYRLLPLAYRNLLHQGEPPEKIEWLRRIHRGTWAENQRLFHAAKTVLVALQGVGIDTLVLKGVPLVLSYYKDYGARPMSDFDLLVREVDAPGAIAVLTNLGWTPYKDPQAHAGEYQKGDFRLDLHWRAIAQCPQEGDEGDFWREAVPVNLLDISCLTLSSTDQLLHVIVHGLQWSELPPVRWIADAVVILREAASEIDWERLSEMARQRRYLYKLCVALGYVRSVFDAPVPLDALTRMKFLPTTRFERLEFRLRAHPPRLWERHLTLWDYLYYVRRVGDPQDFPLSYLNFWLERWSIDRYRQLPLEALKRLAGL
jgi:hypothetical protein